MNPIELKKEKREQLSIANKQKKRCELATKAKNFN
jgi:hypothetical protein